MSSINVARIGTHNLEYNAGERAGALLQSVGLQIGEVLNISSEYQEYQGSFSILGTIQGNVFKGERITADQIAQKQEKVHIILGENSSTGQVKFLGRIEDLQQEGNGNSRYPFTIEK